MRPILGGEDVGSPMYKMGKSRFERKSFLLGEELTGSE